MPRVGVVTGLAQEAAVLLSCGWERRNVVCVGASAERAAVAAARFLDEGCDGLVSFGMAGGLSPELSPGSLLLANAVVTPTLRALAVDPPWHERLQASAREDLSIIGGAIAGTDGAALTPSDKAALWRRTGAVAVDMESHALAAVATERNAPFLVVRAIADPQHQVIPSWLPATIRADGTPDLLRLIRGLARSPGSLGEIVSLAIHSAKATKCLRRVAVGAGRLFHFVA